MTNLDEYNRVLEGTGIEQRNRLNAFLVGYLFSAVDETTATDALAAAERVGVTS